MRRNGYAVAAGERESDLNAVAAPIFDARGLAAIVGLQGPAARLAGPRMAEVAQPLLAVAARASASMGAR